MPCVCLLACLALEESLRAGSSDQYPAGKTLGSQTRTSESNVCSAFSLCFLARRLLQQRCAFLLRQACMHAHHGRYIGLGMVARARSWFPAPAIGPALSSAFWVLRTVCGRAVAVRARKSARGVTLGFAVDGTLGRPQIPQ